MNTLTESIEDLKVIACYDDKVADYEVQNLRGHPPGMGDGAQCLVLPPPSGLITQELRNQLRVSCLEIEQVAGKESTQARSLTRRLFGLINNAQLSKHLVPLINGLYQDGGNRVDDVFRAARLIPDSDGVRTVLSKKAIIRDENLRKGLTRFGEDVRAYSRICENLEQRFFDLYRQADIRNTLDQPDPGRLLKEVAGWIHYPNCGIGGGTSMAIDQLQGHFRLRDIANVAFCWHGAIANRVARTPAKFRLRLQSLLD